MAGNPKWCQPLSVWKEYFTEWIKRPGPDELLEVSIYFDFRFCYGDEGLSGELRHYINNDLITCDIYFHHMTNAWKQFNPSHSHLSQGRTDIKRLLMPLTGIVRLYALRHRTKGLSTAERITELYSEGQINAVIMQETLGAWKDLTAIRLNHQALSVAGGKEPDNSIDLQVVNPEIRYFTEKAAGSINDLLLKAGTDFYTNII
jgi:CBS domain-containing protein